MISITLFNNKGGVGKTSLVYHLAWMYAELGLRVIAADLDPQANLSSFFLEEDRLEELWPEDEHRQTVLGAIKPLLKGTGDIADPFIEEVTDNIGLLVGDLGLSVFEDELSAQWPQCLDGHERAFRVISAFYRLLLAASRSFHADVVLMDIGPNLGAINRAAAIAAKYVVVPLVPDLFSLQGLRNLGPTLAEWRSGWQNRRKKSPVRDLALPEPGMNTLGYTVQQYSLRLDRPVKAYERWLAKIPTVYRQAVLAEEGFEQPPPITEDPYCLGQLKHYRSLAPMAMEARKPIFHLRPADGAIGAHAGSVQQAFTDYEGLARSIADKSGLVIPPV